MPRTFMLETPLMPDSIVSSGSRTRYDVVRDELIGSPRTWLVTGAAGFIGSNLVQELLQLRQHVVGLDNFSTRHRANLREAVPMSAGAPGKFRFVDGVICDPDAVR